jgi:dephospho-CoA kinase
LKAKLVEQLLNLKQQHYNKNSGVKSVVVVEAAVMLEAGWEDILDAVWLLRSPHQHKFLVEHRNHSPDQANMKIQAQSHRRGIAKTTVKEELANGFITAIIDNDGDIDSLTQKLLYAWNDPDCWKQF